MSEQNLSLSVDANSTFSLAAQQNAYPLVRSIKLAYVVDEELLQVKACSYKNLVVDLKSDSSSILSNQWVVDEINPKQIISLPTKPLKIDKTSLQGLTEEERVEISVTVSFKDDPGTTLAKTTFSIAVLPANFWGGESRQPDLLAAFVKPNGIYVESLVRKAAETLEKNGHGRNIDGYQSHTREKPYLMVAALWNVIFGERLAYVTPAQDFARVGQRIRLAADISNSRIGACLDLSLLFASCLECMGLNPVVALSEEHAFVGVWLLDEQFPVLTNDDPMDLRKRVDSNDLVLFDSTFVTNDSPISFAQAASFARDLISEESEEEFVFLVDIKHARAREIRPLSTIENTLDEKEVDASEELMLPEAPPLPPVRKEERIIEETPETRVDNWQRKLLDLTKRNALLSFKDRAVAIRLFCPDIGAMEDSIAAGASFRFVSSDESPLNDSERSDQVFRMQAGSDLHKEYALEQLNKNVLVANMSRKKLEQNAISLFRKTKNDLEEGGSNTLYLALGMLSWKENPDDDRAFRAPLILIPVELTRGSARAPIRVRQLQDETPIFNLTLIEFLDAEYEIDLNEFRLQLPRDDSGVDVAQVWTTVRSAVAEQPGFELKEDLVLSSFSFAKYLMWKDLKDRVGDLKENPFVEHLIDRPQQAYKQTSSFVSYGQVDRDINPQKVFTPLNCDSSQLVAVEASGRPQDFVLEGPPGTGKSETIANIICHNIALGRKILFVAEKMAALNVVYRRMEKIGLDHLCLELHSNKANKKAVLEQLRSASQKRESSSSEGWLASVKTMEEKRDHLNSYVQELHKKSEFGMSAREAISRDVSNADTHSFKLGWGWGREAAPVKSKLEFREMLRTVDQASLAYTGVKDLDHTKLGVIKSISWSNAWQSKVVDILSRYKKSINSIFDISERLASNFNIKVHGKDLASLNKVASLAGLIESAESHSLSYILAKGSKELLKGLDDLSAKKKSFDAALKDIGHNVSPALLAESPVNEWARISNDAKDSWLKSFFAKLKINSAAKKMGYEKFTDLDLVADIERARNLQKLIEPLAENYEQDEIWNGWDTTADSIELAAEHGKFAHRSLSEVLALTDDLADVLTIIKSKLVDGRDYLESSKVVVLKQQFQDAWEMYSGICDEAIALNISMDSSFSLDDCNNTIDFLMDNAPKYKAWSHWQAAKVELGKFRLENLVDAMESGSLKSDEAVEQVDTAFCRWIAPLLIDESEELKGFRALSHDKVIEEFRSVDELVAKTTGEYVAALAAKNIPDPFSDSAPEEFGLLARELQKKTRHSPIRKLFGEMGLRLLDLCPCMMMSPLSVAQFLPSDFSGFDLVVFDEASQMTTWDSVGAIARGKNVIVVGDPKQMPPTSFFSAAVGADDPEEEDLESILDQALAARLPHLRLMGHYRSRHETLIAFSNNKYYENSLVTYPSSDTKESAVILHRVQGVYAKGKGRNNPIEAQAVVSEIVRRLKDPKLCKLSIGVVTLNSEQQRTVEDLLDTARRSNPEIEPFFHSSDDYDEVFVKNLESVQGDERDVIILSLSYGPTEPGGLTMSMNFGPLNKSGGERRLNVAITRATSEVLVFSSFDSAMIDLSRTSALAVEHLKHYLEFAERGTTALAEQATADHGVDQFDSDFEQAVAWALRDKGWKVQTQIGVSKFRVDLGVYHPDYSGVFLAGVECDGATYHSSPSARDRDRVRHGVLEGLGWKLVRLWSTDYFQDPKGAIEKLDHSLNELLEKDRKEREQEEQKIKELEEHSTNLRSEKSENHDTAHDLTEGDDKPRRNLDSRYDNKNYFDLSHEIILSRLVKDILTRKNGITIHELALDIANLHGLSRTSSKQIEHLLKIIKSWAGILDHAVHKPVVWLSPEDVADEIPWRGLDPWGDEREWSEIPYPEAKGLARIALSKRPDDPVEFICDAFKLKRRHQKTIDEFQSWLVNVETNRL